jgi:hypothetical protein
VVRIESVYVTASSVSAGEPGAAAEWRLTVTVNGDSRTWSNNDVRDSTNYSLGWAFPVDLTDPSTTIRISSSGYEEDDFSANDPLPTAEVTHGSATNWGIGSPPPLSASDQQFSYAINYSISCLQKDATSFITRQEALNFIKARLNARGADIRKNDEELLGVFASKMSARGATLRNLQGDMLIWEGPTSIHRLAKEAFVAEGRRGGRQAPEGQ